ncbi:MAG: PorP/SprF family type IX secretion system membrane protein [Bacteroidales bacterium]|jgi:type IX secretion system PorP/SprF family membrane protein|nr:PorP/SprF family type IX secretion system membrane protein [Bacteroidales bacterium]
MNRVPKISIVLFVLCFCLNFIGKKTFAQDIHLSQFWVSPPSINPASAGFMDGDARFSAYLRTQWLSITKAYQTCGVSADLPIVRRPRQQDIFGLGINMDYDRAGDSKLTALSGNLLLSYAHSLNAYNTHFLMGGISIGFQKRTWDYSTLKYDEQYQNGIYNPNIQTSEQFAGNSHWFADIGAGISWFYSPQNENIYQAGISVYHLNCPSITLIEAKQVRLGLRWTLNSELMFNIKDNMTLTPALYFSAQAKYTEFLIGLNYSYAFPIDARGFINKFNIGLCHRWKDAIYFSTGFELRRFLIAISYDFNVSKLIKASQSRGGVEVALSYIIKKERFLRRKPIPCYLF